MIQRYLGNKHFLSDALVQTVRHYAPTGSLVCDIFAGTLSVALAMKLADFRVAANDVNHFTSAYGRAFLTNSTIPHFDMRNLLRRRFKRPSAQASAEENLRLILRFLQNAQCSDVAKRFRRTDFYDHYTEAGSRSGFVSARGRAGRRRFFSPENGARIDIVLGKIREWARTGAIDATATALLSTIACDAIERISNTQGTYHDFPRETYDPRALQGLTLKAPDFTKLYGKRTDHIVGCGDSLEFIRRVPQHEALYVDPPYNFRQYTAYYFMPNVICRYAEIDDLDQYFSEIQYVRGQNMSDDFKSSFCSAATFIQSLEALIERANTRVIMLSYFDARNHWNNTNHAGNGVGVNKLTALFRSKRFTRNSLRIYRFQRTNYQSYGGYRARPIDELLFVAEKR